MRARRLGRYTSSRRRERTGPPGCGHGGTAAAALAAPSETDIETLTADIAKLDRAAGLAAADGDHARLAQLLREKHVLVTKRDTLRERNAPAKPPERWPDMTAAATRAREKLHTAFDNLLHSKIVKTHLAGIYAKEKT